MPSAIIGVDGSGHALPHDHPPGVALTVITASPEVCPACGSVESHAWLVRPQPVHCSPGCGGIYQAASAALLCLTCLRPTRYVPVAPIIPGTP